MSGRARALGAGLVALALLTACSGPGERESTNSTPSPARSSSPSEPAPSAPRRGPIYVALGDSYTAGGPIGVLQEHGFVCQRSTRNYPSLVASTLDLPLTDVSCGGATSDGLLESVRGAPAQIDAIRPTTRVVTVGVGGNDFGLYSSLLLTCPDLSKPGLSGAPCRDRLGAEIAPKIPAISAKVGAALAAVVRKAPNAEVMVVGYPRLMPSSGTCEEAPYTAGDVAWMASLESDLAASLAAAARAHDVTFVPMYARSKGHDVCSGDAAWVNGLKPPDGDGLALHPNAAGERAIADAVTTRLRRLGFG
jgi:lysophospholipase L1-like esterase